MGEFTIRCDECGSEDVTVVMSGLELHEICCESCGNKQTPPPSKGRGHVYFVGGAEPHHPIKIGFTQGMIPDRIRSLQTGSPHRLELLGALTGYPDTERAFHEMFSETRLTGEWFERTEPLVKLIHSLNTASNCPATREKRVAYRPSKPLASRTALVSGDNR